MLLNCVLEKTLESPLDCKEIQPIHPKGNQSWIFIGRIDAEAETPNTLATWCEELTHLKRPWCWEWLKSGREGDDRGWDGCITSPTPGVHPNPCSLSQWCNPTISFILCRPLLLPPSIFPTIRVFSNESVLHIGWPKYWRFSFSISPSNEYSELISFTIDWLDLLASKTRRCISQVPSHWLSSKVGILVYVLGGEPATWTSSPIE